MKKKGLIAGLMALAMVFIASPAQADVIGGGGTAVAGQQLSVGAYAPGNWDRVVGIWDPTGAYDDFLAAAQGNGRYPLLGSAGAVEGHLRNMGILDQCKDARLILYLRDEAYGVWMRFTGGFGLLNEVKNNGWTTVPGNGYVFMSERNAGGSPGWNDNWLTSTGRELTPKQDVQAYANTPGRANDTNIICAWGNSTSTNANEKILTEVTTYERQEANVGAEANFDGVYAYGTTVERQISKDGKDPIGKDNLRTQPVVEVKTNFGNFYDSLSNGGTSESIQSKRDRYNQAIAKDASIGHAKVELIKENKEGLAEGGVLNVTELSHHARVTASENTRWERCIQVTNRKVWNGWEWKLQPVDSRPIWWNGNCDNAPRTGGTPSYNVNDPNAPRGGTEWVHRGTSYSSGRIWGTSQNTGFWQILSVHCNEDELNALLAAVEGETIVAQTPGVDGKSTTVVHSKKYDSRPSVLDFGHDRKDGSPKSRSGQLGFYDKECDIACTIPEPDMKFRPAFINNNSITNSQGKDYFGGALIQDDKTSSANYFEVFRDNSERKISVNVSHPVNGDPQFKYSGTFKNEAGPGNVVFPPVRPKSTTVTIEKTGTPKTDSDTLANKGGQFSMIALTKDEKKDDVRIPLFKGAGIPKTQKNWTIDPYDTATSTTINGFANEFIVKSTWASETNLPHAINVKWEYEPTVWTRIPSSVGFTGGGSNQLHIGGYAVQDTPVDGRCYAQYGTYERNMDLSKRVQESTGTGTENKLDQSLVEGYSGDQSWQKHTNLVLKFVRAVSE